MTIAATSTLADDARRLIALTAQAEDIDHQIRDIKARIAEAVPVGEKVTVDGQPVLSVRISGRRFDPKLEIERLRAAVQAVLDLHMPVVDGRLAMRTDADGWCDSDKENYPCTTIRALDAALGGERVRPRRLPREVQVQIEGEQDE